MCLCFDYYLAIGALKTLELLDVSFNYLEKLPEEIGCLKKLKRLYAFGNKLKQLPKCTVYLFHT
jgi:Leucine-rich repeat (LRR) protein